MRKNKKFKKTICSIRKTGSALLLKGSLTVEAAVCMTALISAILLILGLIPVMEAERKLHNKMEACAKDLSAAAYIKNSGLISVSSETESLITGIGEGAVIAYLLLDANSDDSIGAALFTPETSVLSKEEDADENMIFMELEYTPSFFSFTLPLPFMRKTLVVNRRAWTGSDGGRGRDSYGNTSEFNGNENEDPIVYLGRDSTRYHLSPDCHYLSNNMRVSDAETVKELRNKYGGRYHACSSCRPESGTVYYFENGGAYHKSEDCKAITSYIREARLSEVAYLGCCSYCLKNNKDQL